MAIEYSTELDGNLLRVTTWGYDETTEQSIEYGLSLVRIASENNCQYAICDERNLEYRLSTLDTYNMAAAIAQIAPRIGRVAIVCREQDYDDAEFFEDVVVNRGCTIKVFKDMGEAEAWIKESMKHI